MLNISKSPNTIRTIKPGDPDWNINTGLTFAPRAGFEISAECPRDYRMVMLECINNGWIKPLANVLEKDYTWEKLSK